jgi:hypothetical protein
VRGDEDSAGDGGVDVHAAGADGEVGTEARGEGFGGDGSGDWVQEVREGGGRG